MIAECFSHGFSLHLDISRSRCGIVFGGLREIKNFARIERFMNKYQKCITPDQTSLRITFGGFLSACVALILLLTPVAKVEAAHGELRDQFDTIAGKGLTVESAELKWLQRQEVMFLFDCAGKRFERRADVDGPRAEVVLKDEDVTTAGICHVHIEHKGEDVDAFYFEVFADTTMEKEIVQATKEDLFRGERAEFKAGAFDKFGNSTIDTFVIVSGDGPIEEEGEKDPAGYRHFFFTPEEVGIATIELVEPNAGPKGRTEFKFEVLDPTPPPAASAPAQGRGDAVTLLLGQLIRASLLDEYGSAPAAGEIAGDQGYGLVDSFDVEIGDSESTLHVNEQYDLAITALDRRGKRVQNYVDRVIVETSDPDAIVPSGTIRFKATDRGQKLLSLAVMFQTPGQQTVTIRDEADPEEIFGKTSVWVLGQTSAPASRTIVLNEKSGTVRGSKASISGTAPAYTNLQLFTVEDGSDRELAMTASDADGKFRFEIALEGGRAHTLFVRDPEERVKDSETITLTADATMPVLRSAVLTPSTVVPGASFTVSVVAETGQRAFASLPQGAKTELPRKRPDEEAGFDVYEGTLMAPAIAGTHAVTITIADSAGNETAETRMLAVATEATGFPVVENLRATVQNQDVLLSWSPVTGAVRYRVYFGSSASNMERFVETQSATTSIRLTGLTGGQATFFAVTALGTNGEESIQKSTVVSAIPRGSLFELTAFPQVNGAVLRWAAPLGADIAGYLIRYGVQPNLPTEERMVPANTLEYGVRDLINGVTYYFALEAVYRNGDLLKDTVEVSATPGQNGMPGVSVSPMDPLPAGIGGPGAATALPRGTPHGTAPAHVPESGSALLLWMILALAGGGGWFGLRSFRMRKLEREFLVSYQR